MLINFPVDTRGLIHENDEAAILRFGEKIKKDFELNLASFAEIEAIGDRGKGYEAENVLDEEYETYWTLKDGSPQSELVMDFGKEISFNRLLLQEYTPLGQRVKAFSLEREVAGNWEKIAEATTIGYKRILRFDDVKAQRIRIKFLDGKDIPLISKVGIYNAPKLLIAPTISRKTDGTVELVSPDSGLEIFYSLDGSTPGKESQKYESPIAVIEALTLMAASFDPGSGEMSEPVRIDLDLPKGNWKPLEADAEKAIDENMGSFWTSPAGELSIDLGESIDLKGFTFLPMQARYPSGIITNYSVEISQDGKTWKEIASGEFSNIVNSPIEQQVRFESVSARFIRLKAVKTADGNPATFGEIGILTR